MSSVSNQVRDAGAMLPAVDAVTNGRALLLELAAMAVGVTLAGGLVAAALGGAYALFVLAWLLFVLLAGLGFNAAGVTLMDDVYAGTRRGLADTWLAALFAFGKALVVACVAGLALLVALLLVALLLWICKVPGLGPVLYFVVFPLSAVLLGVLFVSFAFVLAPIAMPAIWSGETIGATLARVVMVIRRRLLGVLVRGCVLSVLLAVTGAILASIAFSGLFAAGSLSLAVVGVDVDLSSLTGGLFGDRYGGGMRGLRAGGPRGAGGGHVLAMMVGVALIAVTVGTLLSLVLKKGWCLIYLQVASDLDVSKVEAEMQARLAQVRAQAQAARERVQQQNRAVPPAAGTQGPAGVSGPSVDGPR